VEIFDLYDENFNLLDKKMERGGTNNDGEYHLVAHIWIKNSKGEYLVQQRNKLSDKIPYQWAATGGAATTGDSSLEAAQRETYEELGINIPLEKFQLLNRYYVKDEIANFITDQYLIKEDILLSDIKIDTVEVKDVAYKTMKEIKQMIQNNQFWKYEDREERIGYLDILEKS
jgi:isopentenyldiphosphate isomerase